MVMLSDFLFNPMLDSSPDPAILRKQLEDEANQAARADFLTRDKTHLGRLGTILTPRTTAPSQVGYTPPGTVIGRPYRSPIGG